MATQAPTLEDTSLKSIIAHAKEYGFVYPSSEIYDGLQAVYDFGPYGVALKNNIKQLWWKSMVQLHENIVGIDASIFMHPKTWVASGHVSSFNDPMVDNKDSKKRYRVDTLIEDFAENLRQNGNEDKAQHVIEEMEHLLEQDNLDGLHDLIVKEQITCPISGTVNWTEVRQFNLMFETKVGSVAEEADTLYLRPETAQGIFVNFLNVQKTARQKVPFGIAQIGKAFRNEIVARQFIFRMREFEQMEMQFFVREDHGMLWYEHWKEKRMKWYHALGIPEASLQYHDHIKLAHYARAAVDIEFNFPFGKKEIEGIHYRTDFDLKSHAEVSRKKIQYFDPEVNKNYIPHVVETSAGCDRLFLMLMSHAYREEEVQDGDKVKQRTLLKFHPTLAPMKGAILPLVRKDGLPEKAMALFNDLKFDFPLIYEEKQAIGKRYTRQDLIGTPFCFTVDHQSLEDDTVTVRYRDSMKQERIPMAAVHKLLAEHTAESTFLKSL